MVVHWVLMIITGTLIDEPLSCLVGHLHYCIFNTAYVTAKVSELLKRPDCSILQLLAHSLKPRSG
jgi:hypothetical protein